MIGGEIQRPDISGRLFLKIFLTDTGVNMTKNPPNYKRIRKNFGHIKSIVDIPDLIGMQRDSYNRFLQMNVLPENRKDAGLQSVFNSVFPIKDFTNTASLEFVSYHFAEIKHSVGECISRGMTYDISLRIRHGGTGDPAI